MVDGTLGPAKSHAGGMPWPWAPSWMLPEKLHSVESKQAEPSVWHLLSAACEDGGGKCDRDELPSTEASPAKNKAWIFD